MTGTNTPLEILKAFWRDDDPDSQEALTALLKTVDRYVEERELLARIGELSQTFLSADLTCLVDSLTGKPITVKERKEHLYEQKES